MTPTDEFSVERRTVLRGLGALALVGSVAGCTTETDGGDGDSGATDTPDSTPADADTATATDSGSASGDGGGAGVSAVEEYLSDAGNYDGVEDMSGSGSVTVEVGAQGNGGGFAFAPAAIRVAPGTTVTWEWTGKGGQHNVVHEGGAFESELVTEAGHTFEYTFEEAGTYRYYCQPHRALGMKGVVVVG
jgi:halocyanin-like protein